MLEVVHPDSGKSLPEGQLLRLAGPTGDEWLVMAVHESRESWGRFRDDTWMPSAEAGEACRSPVLISP